MKNVRALSIATATLALAVLAAGTALAANVVAPKTVAFKGIYAGTVTEKVDGQTVSALASASGKGTVIGKGKLSGIVDGHDVEPALLAAQRPRHDLRPGGQAEAHAPLHLARLRRVRRGPERHHGLRQREGRRRHAQVQEGPGHAPFQRSLRPRDRRLQREAHGKAHLLAPRDPYTRHEEKRCRKVKRILPAALAAIAAVVIVRGAIADTIPFPAVHSGDVFVIAHTVTTDGAMSSSFAPGSNVVFRAYAVDGKTHKVLTEGRRDVLLRDDPEPAERQAEVRPEGPRRERPVHLDGHVGRAGQLPDRPRQLQGAGQVDGEAARLVRADAGRDVPADDRDEPPASRGQRPRNGDPPRRPARSTRRSTPTASTGRVPQAPHRGRSAARRPTCTSAASSSCSATWGFDLATATSSRSTTSSRRTSRSRA